MANYSKLGLLLAGDIGHILARQQEVRVLQLVAGGDASTHAPVRAINWIGVSKFIVEVGVVICLRELTNKRLAGHIASGIGEEIDCSIGNITDMANTTEGLRLDVGSLGVGWKQTLQALWISSCQLELNHHYGYETYFGLCNWAGSDDVGGHSTWAILNGH